METKHLIERHPYLFHMAEPGSWTSISNSGLLSTSAALDRYHISGNERKILEENHRPIKATIGNPEDKVTLRDQKPMPPERISKALPDGITPEEWYKFLNNKVFMWAEEARLFRLLNAREYRNSEHDVLTIDTKSLISQYEGKAWLCHMNSGNTFPMPHPRDWNTFRRISDYPSKPLTGKPEKTIVEVVFDYSIPNIKDFVVEVRRIKGHEVINKILSKTQ